MLTVRLLGIDGTGWYPSFDVRLAEAVPFTAPWWATAVNVSAVPSYANLTIDVSVPRVEVLGELIGGAVSVAEMRTRAHTLQRLPR